MAIDPDQYWFAHEPYGHQMKILRETWRRKAWALFMEMGTGKSKILLDTAGLLYLDGEIDTVVVFAKKGEYANWHHVEIPEHVPAQIPIDSYLFSTLRHRSSDGKSRWRRFTDTSLPRRLRFFIINVEAMSSILAEDALDEVAKTAKGVMLIVDESTCVKNHNASRTKKIIRFASRCRYRRIATGTAVTQSPQDLWGQTLVLGRGLLSTTSFTAFRHRYCNEVELHLGMRTVKKYEGGRNLEELSQQIRTFATVMSKKECVDLPPKIYSKLAVEMTTRQAEMYSELKGKALLALEDQTIEVTNVMALVSKLHQVACGQLKLDDGSYVSIPNNRVDALLGILDEHRGKALVWASYRQTLADVYEAVRREHGDRAVAPYYGGVDVETRATALKRFQDPADPLRFIVANPQSAGYGLTLTAADLAVYYSNGPNLEHRLQSEDRIHRIGQTRPAQYVDLFVPGTIDERMMEILRKKDDMSRIIMRGPGQVRNWL